MKFIPPWFLTAIAASLPFQGSAEDLTADQIIDKANQASYYAGTDGRADVRMEIKDSRGGVRVREFRILRRNGDGGDQKFFVYFQAPADVFKTSYLVWKRAAENQEDDRWLFLPDLNLVKRIAPGDKRTSFMGSDFVYEDVSGRHPRADRHEVLKETGETVTIRNTPVDPASVEFTHYDVTIDKSTWLPRSAEYTNAAGEVYRKVTANRVEVIQDIPTVMESEVHDLKTGSRTVNTFSNVGYNLGLDDRLFSERFLRRPPKEAVR